MSLKLISAACAALALGCALMFAFGPTQAVADDKKTEPTPTTKPGANDLSKAIDDGIAKVWQRDGITPAPLSTDEEFLRRVYCTVVGVPPTPDEARAFYNDAAKDKRARLIDKLLDDPRFGQHLGDQWTAVLMGRNPRATGDNAHFLALWLSKQFNENKAFDQTVYDIITASGWVSDNPAGAYWAIRREQRNTDFAGLASKHFTGVQIQCAQCHKHPYEEISQQDFGGVAALFSFVNIRRNGDNEPRTWAIEDRSQSRNVENYRNLLKSKKAPDEKALAKQIEEGKYLAPKQLHGAAVASNDTKLYRAIYARWVIDAGNKQSHRYWVNRFWSFLFGQGFVTPIDDFNSFNTPTHPELLEFLAEDLRANKFDIKRFYRGVLNSRTFQLSSAGGKRAGGIPTEAWHYASAPVRQLSPEQFFGALVTVAGDEQMLREFRKRFQNPYAKVLKAADREAAEKEREDEARKREEKKAEKGKDDAMEEMGGAMEKDTEKDAEKGADKDERKKDAKPGTEDDKKKDLKPKKVIDVDQARKFAEMFDAIDDAWLARRMLSRNFSITSEDDEMIDADAFSLTIDQALMVMNGGVTASLSTYSRRGSMLYRVIRSGDSHEARIDELFLTVLARKPKETERKKMLDFLAEGIKAGGSLERVYEDMLYALLMTTEFATTH